MQEVSQPPSAPSKQIRSVSQPHKIVARNIGEELALAEITKPEEAFEQLLDEWPAPSGIRIDCSHMRSPLLIGISMLCPFLLAAGVEVRNDIVYSRVSGEALAMDAHIPDGPGPFAAIILVYGGGWSAGTKQAAFIKPLLPVLDGSGLAWFSIDYRLSPKYKHPAAAEDVEQAIRYVKSHAREFRVDPNRLALMGESAGGHLVGLVALNHQKDTGVAAVVPFYGAFDLESMLLARGQVSAGYTNFLGITNLSENSRKVLREASADHYMKPGLPPFLLLHGTKDEAVPYEQSVKFCADLKAAGNSCDLFTVENGIHGVINWEKNPEQHSYKAVLVDWLRAKLK